MSDRKARQVPSEFLSQYSQEHGFVFLHDVNIDQQITSVSHSKYGCSARQFSDAELELLIAKIKVAKEQALDNANETLAMLQAILTGDADGNP